MSIVREPIRNGLPFARRQLNRRGIEVVQRLQEAGFEAYFVGGCVRDLLLGQQPKDFDIATSARPQQVRRLFRRSRVIGRRFKLVHVYAGREVYEVATFRSAPADSETGETEIIREDNTFGSAEEDALRRDFTVNALFLDPVQEEIVDWVGGLDDVRARRLRSIGDPDVRFREDPVRILRLVKFLRRLELDPGEPEIRAARRLVPHIAKAASPRVVEELFRLMLTGDMEGVMEDLEALGAVPRILPDLAAWQRRRDPQMERVLARVRILDDWVREGGEPCYSLRLAVLYGPMIEDELDPRSRTVQARESAQVISHVFSGLQQRARLPRYVLDRARKILLAQQRFDPLPHDRRSRRRRDVERTVEQEWFPDALEYLRCRLEADGRDLAPYDEWHERALAIQRNGR